MPQASARGESLGLSEDELAFYDALEVNDSAVKVLDEPTLVDIARELVATVKKNVTIDWTVRENVRATAHPAQCRNGKHISFRQPTQVSAKAAQS